MRSMGFDRPIVVYDGGVVFKRCRRGCVHSLATARVFRRCPRSLRGTRGRATVPAMARSGISSVFGRLVGCRWSRRDILDLRNGLLAPLGCIALEWLVPDVQSS